MNKLKKVVTASLLGIVFLTNSAISSNSLQASAIEKGNLHKTYNISYKGYKTKQVAVTSVDFTKYMSNNASEKAFTNFDKYISTDIKNQINQEQKEFFVDNVSSYDDFDLQLQEQQFTTKVKANSKKYLSLENKSTYKSIHSGKVTCIIKTYYIFNKKTGTLYRQKDASKIVSNLNVSSIKNAYIKKYANKKYTKGYVPVSFYKKQLEHNAWDTKNANNWYINKDGKISYVGSLSEPIKGSYKKKKEKDGGYSERASYKAKDIVLVLPNKLK